MALRRVGPARGRRRRASSAYMHNALAPGLGKIGVLVALESTGDGRASSALSASSSPCMWPPPTRNISTSPRSMPPALERERDVLREQARASGKAEEIIDKMVEGRLRKFYEEVVLLEQIFVIDGEKRNAKVVEAAAKEIGAPVEVTGFVRFALGEGIEKERRRILPPRWRRSSALSDCGGRCPRA